MDQRVAEECIFDIDQSSAEFRRDPERWNEIRRKCPVAWNPRHGGFWMVTGYEGAAQVSRDSATFAHRYEPDSPDGIDYIGTFGIPRWPGRPPLGLQEEDGHRHTEARRALNPLFAPGPIEQERPAMRAVASWFLDQHIEAGEMDFVLDYANPVPAVITLRRMGLPVQNWELWSHTMHGVMAYPQGSPEQIEAAAGAKVLQQEMLETALLRREDPKDDPTTAIANLRIDGELLDDYDLGRTMWTITVGGLNTTTGLTALAVQYLASHPQDRQRLIDHPELYPSATEEFLRFFTIARGGTRTVTNDVELDGQTLHRGDHLLVNRHSANLDETEFDHPDQIILDREENRHLAFGLGPHRCIGSSVARVMFQVVLHEVLQRIPDLAVDDSRVVAYDGSPNITGIMEMPVTFTPGPKVNAESPI
jgi:cytochrome P450